VTRYNLEWDYGHWKQHRLHHRMWRHYQATGYPMWTEE
jgi:hypothetical protein